MAKNKNYVFFYGGIYSQHYRSDFSIKGIVYNCAEQYMMAKKAVLFNDSVNHKKIMSESDPMIQKAIGRKVRGFNKDVWTLKCKDIVYEANYAKFSQNPKLLELMLKETRELVEASPSDKIWGIGMREDNPKIHDRRNWLGTNWLGEALMRVRENLRVVLEGNKEII